MSRGIIIDFFFLRYLHDFFYAWPKLREIAFEFQIDFGIHFWITKEKSYSHCDFALPKIVASYFKRKLAFFEYTEVTPKLLWKLLQIYSRLTLKF